MSCLTKKKIQFGIEDTKHLFDNFSAEYKRFDMYTKKCVYVAPEPVCLSTAEVFDQDFGKVVDEETYASHVPIVQTFSFVFRIVADTTVKLVDGLIKEGTLNLHALSSRIKTFNFCES